MLPHYWKKSKPNGQPAQVKKPGVKNPDFYFIAHLAGALLIIYCQIKLTLYIQMIL